MILMFEGEVQSLPHRKILQSNSHKKARAEGLVVEKRSSLLRLVNFFIAVGNKLERFSTTNSSALAYLWLFDLSFFLCGRLLASPSNIRIMLKSFVVQNTSAYCMQL